jgi:hypothetical protein
MHFSAISSENHRNNVFEHTLCHVDRGTYGIVKCGKFINTQQMSEKNMKGTRILSSFFYLWIDCIVLDEC